MKSPTTKPRPRPYVWAALSLLACADSDRPASSKPQPAGAAAVTRADASADGSDCLACLVPAGGRAAASGSDTCGNGIDDDDDGKVDNDCACAAGSSQRCFTGDASLAGVGACKWGVQHCAGDDSREFRSWGPCLEQGEPVAERCDDSVDNDCDGSVDEDCGCKEGSSVECSSVCGKGERICRNHNYGDCSARTPSTELCNAVDDDCDGTIDELEEACSNACGAGHRRCMDGKWSACDAKAPETETCNGLDDDCDGVVDALQMSCSSACGTGSRTCEDGAWSSCSARAPRSESCNKLDDDCDGDTDEGVAAEWSFANTCSDARVFIAIGGCNVCAGTCNGHWIEPGDSYTVQLEQGACMTTSALARTRDGDVCLNAANGEPVGETRDFCYENCSPVRIPMRCEPVN